MNPSTAEGVAHRRGVLRPVVLTSAREPSRGSALVRAQRELAAEALRRSALVSGAELGALECDVLGAPLASNGWHWSTAHTRGMAAGVVHDSPVGIDVERIEPRKPELARWIVSEEEELVLGGCSPLELTLAWTAKECVLKRAGIGLAELSHCRVVERASDTTLRVRHRDFLFAVDQRVIGTHVVALCCGEARDPRHVAPSHVEWTVEARDGSSDR